MNSIAKKIACAAVDQEAAHEILMGCARGTRARELTDFVRWEARGARCRAVVWQAGGAGCPGAVRVATEKGTHCRLLAKERWWVRGRCRVRALLSDGRYE